METAARRSLALLAAIQFLLVLDTAIINVAAPSIGTELGISAAGLSWVANAYLVTFGGLLLLSGRAADLLDRRTLLVSGLAVLVAGSVVGAVAGEAVVLITARALQGIGAAVAAASAFAVLIDLFPEGPDRHRALGVFAAMAGAGGATGTVLGGVLTSWLGWRSTFGLNILAGGLLAVLVLRIVRPRTLVRPRNARIAGGFDLRGALLATSGLGLLAFALVNAGVDGWTSPRTVAPGLSAVLLLGLFVLLERHTPAPLVPPEVWRRPVPRTANLLSGLGQVVLFPMFFLVSVYLQGVLSFTPMQGGLGLLPLSVTVIAVAGNVGRLIGLIGLRWTMMAGFAVVAVGMAWLAALDPDGTYAVDVLFPSLLLGAGLPLIAVTTNVAATHQASGEEVGLASGMINTSQQFGAVIGLAVLSGVAASVSRGAADPASAAALTRGFGIAFLAGAAVALPAAVIAARLPVDHRPEPTARAMRRAASRNRSGGSAA